MYLNVDWRGGWPWIQTNPTGTWRKASKDLAIELMQERIRNLEEMLAVQPTTPDT